MALLSNQEINSELKVLNTAIDTAWLVEKKSLYKAFEFSDFKAAFAFMTALADYAERVDHHPNWRNCYRRVEIRLSTFDVHGLTQQDFDFAQQVEKHLRA